MTARRSASVCTFSLIAVAMAAAGAGAPPPAAPPLPLIDAVDAQPLVAQARRVAAAMDYLGSPLSDTTKAALDEAAQETDPAQAVRKVQAALDPYCLLGVYTDPSVQAGVVPGPARHELVEEGWRQFLVKVYNSAGVIAELRPLSRSAKPLFNSPSTDLTGRWLDMQMFNSQPLQLKLSGLGL